MTIKNLEKINLRKKTEGILLFNITNWYWGQKLFGFLIWSLYIDTKCHILTVGAQNIAHVCQNLENCRRNISAHAKKDAKAAVFLFKRTWTWKLFKILTNLKILIIFVHIVSL
jgi:hypothetical protein